MIDYSLWEVIENGNAPPITTLLKEIYEPEVKGTSSSSTQNVAFVSSNSTSSTNGVVNTAHGATTASTQATAVNSTTIDNLSDAVICAFFASQPKKSANCHVYILLVYRMDGDIGWNCVFNNSLTSS
ncbi:hypothetical protein Tco_0083435 [Tanacetum coccineum]